MEGRVNDTKWGRHQSIHFFSPSIGLFLLVFVIGMNTNAQERDVILGIVSDSATSKGIPNVTVRSLPENRATFSNESGHFRLFVSTGPLEIRFSHIGYLQQVIRIRTKPGDSLHVNVVLVPATYKLAEVTVVSDSQPIARIRSLGAITFSPIKLQNTSGAFGDIAKVLQTMAGVSANNETSAQFSVRGGTMFHNLLLFNGAELLDPYHLRDSPNSGLVVVNTSILDRVIFVPGGFTARYGDRLSAVIELEQREGNRDWLAGRVDASLTDAMAVVEGPIGRGSSALLSFRTSYGNYIARYLTDQSQRRPTFYDLVGSVALHPSADHQLSISVLHAFDRASGLSDGEYSTSMAGIQSRHFISPSVSVRGTISISPQAENIKRTAAVLQDHGVDWSRDSTGIVLAEGGAHLDAQIADLISVALGFRVQHGDYNISRTEVVRDNGSEHLSSGRMHNSATKTALYSENIVRITPSVQVNAGLRFDSFSLTHEHVFSPRILLSYDVGEQTTLKVAWGLYYQTAMYRQLFAASQAGVEPQRMQLAEHFIVGVENNLRHGMRFRGEAYYKKLDRLISYDRLRTGDFIYSTRNDSRGEIYGLDCEVSFRDERVMGWFNVAWMKAKEVNDTPGSQWHNSPTDQRMTLNFVFEPKIAEGWVLSLRSMYGSGYAYVTDLPGTRSFVRDHYPDYKRIDLRLNYSFKTGPLQTTAFIEITNVYSMRNVRSFQGTLHDDSTPDYNLLLPMIINVGIRYEY